MSIYEIGTYEECKDEVTIAPSGTYDLLVEDIEETRTSKGRPMLVATFRIIKPQDPKAHNKLVKDNFPMPWLNPETGQRETTGRFRFTNFVLACGASWEGNRIDTSILRGRRFKGIVDQEEIKTRDGEALVGTGEFRNVIRRYIPGKAAGEVAPGVKAPPRPKAAG